MTQQTSMFKGAHAGAADNHANRGMAFEEQLKWQHALYHKQGVAKMDKQYIPSLPVKDGKWAKGIGKSTVDFVGVLNGGRRTAQASGLSWTGWRHTSWSIWKRLRLWAGWRSFWCDLNGRGYG